MGRLEEIKRKRSGSTDFGAVGLSENEYVTAADVDWLISQIEAFGRDEQLMQEAVENFRQCLGLDILHALSARCPSCQSLAARISAIRKVVGDE